MITFIRSIVTSRFGAIFALLFVAVLALGFVLGDVTGNSSFGGLGGGNVARVGDKSITIGELNDTLQNRLRAERQQNPNLDMANFVESGGFEATIQRLLSSYGLSEFGKAAGLAVSKRIVDYEIKKLPGAKGLDGQFSQEAFQAFLAQNRLSEKSFRDLYAQDLFNQQMATAFGSGQPPPAGFALPYASLQLEQRSGQFALVPSQSFLPSTDPAPTVLAKYYADNSTRFTIPEQRAISYALFDSSIVNSKAKPTPAEIADYYRKNQASFAASEVRDISRFVVPTEAAAKAAIAQINGGKPFETVATQLGLSVTTEKALSKEAFAGVSSKAAADAVFAAAKGKVAAPARGALGYFVAMATDIRKVEARSLAAASAQIALLLESEKRESVLAEFTGEIEDALADGQSINDVARAQNLKLEVTPKLFANGQSPATPDYQLIKEMGTILPAAFQLEEDGSAQLIEIVPGKTFALIAVADFEKAAPPPLAKVRSIVVEQWKLAEGAKRAKAAAEKLRKLVASGKSMADSLAALQIKAPSPESISGTRGELSRDAGRLSPPLLLLFSMKQGTAKTLAAPGEAGWLLVKLDRIIKGNAAADQALVAAKSAELANFINQELSAQFIAAALKEVGVKKNEGAIASLRKRLTSNDNN